jgi:hypothetical protein
MSAFDYVEQLCCLCEKPITAQDATVEGGGVQVMSLGGKAHRTRCWLPRYSDRPVQASLALSDQERPPQAPRIAPATSSAALEVEVDRLANPIYLAWQVIDPKQSVAEAIGDAAERYVEKMGEHPNAALLNERDWKRSGLAIGEVVHGCSVRVSFMIPDPGVLKVAKE